MDPRDPAHPVCTACRDGEDLDFDFTIAFQPIVDVRERTVFAYEALVRGLNGEGALEILGRVNDRNKYAFDQACRVKAVERAASAGIDCYVSINFLPNAIYEPANCIRATLHAARKFGFPANKLLFEMTERETLLDPAHLRSISKEYQKQGFKTAIDDYGAGYAGLTLLADFQPDIVKLDMSLARHIDRDPVRQAIVRGVMVTMAALDIEVIAEGVEDEAECEWLMGVGIHLFQGHLFARAQVGPLPIVAWPVCVLPGGTGSPTP